MSWRSLKEEEDFIGAVETEIICTEEYCPFHYKHLSSPSRPCCEGDYCEEAWANYCEKHDKEYEQ